jgi:hypothetical protein
VEHLFKKCCITGALGNTEDIIWDNSDLYYLDLKIDLEGFVDFEYETGCTNEDDSR